VSKKSPPNVAPAPLPPLDPLRRYSVEQALEYLATSRATLYKQIAHGAIKTIQHGTRRYVPGSEIVRLSSVPA
jgi:excisionase family DNA binding protein